jgi:hypothetical protein
MSAEGPGGEDSFVPDRIHAAADYLLDLFTRIPPDLIRSARYRDG